MGYMELTVNEVLNLASYGFKQGDTIKVTCVGGGGGSNNTNTSYWGGHRHLPGYGAGGVAYNTSNNVAQNYSGDRGNIKSEVIKLGGDVNSIPVTIGAGGVRYNNGGSTSFGTYVTALGGDANGVYWAADNAAGYVPRTKSTHLKSIRIEYIEITSKVGSGIVILEW